MDCCNGMTDAHCHSELGDAVSTKNVKLLSCEVRLNDINDNYFDCERYEQEVLSLSLQHAAALLVEQSVNSLW